MCFYLSAQDSPEFEQVQKKQVMFTQFATYVTTWLSRTGVIQDDDIELYQYGFFILLTGIFHFIITVVLGFFFNVFCESILFYIMFTLLRSYAGGIHAKTESQCLVLSDLAILICVAGIRILQNSSSIMPPLILLSVGFGCILKLSPLDTEEKPLSAEERRLYKMHSQCIALNIVVLAVVAYAIGINGIFHCAAVSLALESLLLVAGKMSKYGQTSDYPE